MTLKGKTYAAKNEVLIRHLFNAPLHLVFDAWTDPVQLPQWFAPDGCSIFYKKLNLCEGGKFHSCFSNPLHGDCWCVGTYHEITRNRKIVYSIAISNESGEIVKPADVGMDPDWPGETLVTITFKDLGDLTEITLHQTVSEKVAKRSGAHPSWIQMFERLCKMTVEKNIQS
ncbi:MAG TPA: SRPBCC domain-containing protein [Bacteroidia bacterium]|mgnify:CR=1 FL=1|nr:SRPBCC domain-containing protein [Bacteroidia bacterium]